MRKREEGVRRWKKTNGIKLMRVEESGRRRKKIIKNVE